MCDLFPRSKEWSSCPAETASNGCACCPLFRDNHACGFDARRMQREAKSCYWRNCWRMHVGYSALLHLLFHSWRPVCRRASKEHVPRVPPSHISSRLKTGSPCGRCSSRSSHSLQSVDNEVSQHCWLNRLHVEHCPGRSKRAEFLAISRPCWRRKHTMDHWN